MSKIQYTIRGIPLPVDQVIRKRAQQSGRSFNQTVVDMLSLQTFGTTQPSDTHGALERLFGASLLDEDFDAAIASQSKVDPKIWG